MNEMFEKKPENAKAGIEVRNVSLALIALLGLNQDKMAPSKGPQQAARVPFDHVSPVTWQQEGIAHQLEQYSSFVKFDPKSGALTLVAEESGPRVLSTPEQQLKNVYVATYNRGAGLLFVYKLKDRTTRIVQVGSQPKKDGTGLQFFVRTGNISPRGTVTEDFKYRDPD
jgi:hypothetical protein